MLRTLVAAGSALLLGAAVLVPSGLPASASPDREDVEQRQDEVQQGREQSRDSLEHVSAELIAASDRLAELQAQLPGARRAVASAESEAQAARDRDAELAESAMRSHILAARYAARRLAEAPEHRPDHDTMVDSLTD